MPPAPLKPPVLSADAYAVLGGALALTAILGASKILGGGPAVERIPSVSSSLDRGERLLKASCPPHSLPDLGVCIPVGSARVPGGPLLRATKNRHTDRSGFVRMYDQIPLQGDRPSDYRKYRFPITPQPHQNVQASGFDLDLPDLEQRRGAELPSVGHGGVDLAQARGTDVRVVDLEHQTGSADVIFVGWLFGNTVVTAHRVVQGGRPVEYLVIYGHLDAPARDLKARMPIPEGALLGRVGDSGAPGDVHLHLETRQVRPGVTVLDLTARELLEPSKTIACDPRNLFPVRSG